MDLRPVRARAPAEPARRPRSPSAAPGTAATRPSSSSGGLQDAALAAFGALGFGAFTVPGLVMGVPGLLLVLAVLFQLLGGSAFVPIARRWQRGVGLRRHPVARIVRDR